jgi:crotonobetainyl-CoA:carnitine CoA-transferase CaiB-like acyl-CoA transferase
MIKVYIGIYPHDYVVFKVMYKFVDEDISYICYMTHKQYINFIDLPSIDKVTILKRNQVERKQYEDEMQRSIDEAFANNTSHIKRLSDEI